jgi:hypothetical protein
VFGRRDTSKARYCYVRAGDIVSAIKCSGDDPKAIDELIRDSDVVTDVEKISRLDAAIDVLGDGSTYSAPYRKMRDAILETNPSLDPKYPK